MVLGVFLPLLVSFSPGHRSPACYPPASHCLALFASDNSAHSQCVEDGAAAIRVHRVAPGDAAVTAQLAALLVDAFYGRHRALNGPIAWVQRQVLEADVCNELGSRLRYYERAREQCLPHIGAVLAATTADGVLCGFLDIGRPKYSTAKGFRLPSHPSGGSTTVEESGEHEQELRAYVSNLAVGSESRRRGIGRLLMQECELEVRQWLPAQDYIWLEVSDSNSAAVSFYGSLGYERVGHTSGREIVKRQFSYTPELVQRGLLRKPLTHGG